MASADEEGDAHGATSTAMNLAPVHKTVDPTPGITESRRPRDGPENAYTPEEGKQVSGRHDSGDHWRSPAILSVNSRGQERASISPDNTAVQRPCVGTENAQVGKESEWQSGRRGRSEHWRASAHPSISAPMSSTPASILAYREDTSVGENMSAKLASNSHPRSTVRRPQQIAATIPPPPTPVSPLPPPTLSLEACPTMGIAPDRQQQGHTARNQGRRWLGIRRVSQAFRPNLTLHRKRRSQTSDADSDDSWTCTTARLLEDEHSHNSSAGEVLADKIPSVQATQDTLSDCAPQDPAVEPDALRTTIEQPPPPPESKRSSRFSQLFGKFSDGTSISR